ncbi:MULTISPECIES: hypothetical protein [unclassified Tychonema]|nr:MULTISPECIES: hypothetical protein [unclassified Tychonema]
MSDKKSSRSLGSICVLLECVGDFLDRTRTKKYFYKAGDATAS